MFIFIIKPEEGYEALGPYVDIKISEAYTKGKNCKEDEMIRLLVTDIGTGLAVQESIPAVFAIMAGSNGDFEKALSYAIYSGGDTDTIASMVGAILGGYHGIEVIPDHIIKK